MTVQNSVEIGKKRIQSIDFWLDTHSHMLPLHFILHNKNEQIIGRTKTFQAQKKLQLWRVINIKRG